MAVKKKNVKDQEMTTENENIVVTEYSGEMKQSFIDYAMSVLVARAVPDIKDGLKPVHRRILYAMKDAGLYHDKAYRKSANVVGKTLADTHPHGDSSVYEAMVNMTHDYSLTTPLIDGHGNWGSIEGDMYAANRYTECRLQGYSEDVFLQDLSKDTVKFIPNYDNSKIEPEVLPAKVPNVLVNGTNGIAIGTTTSTPTHNLNEVIDTYIAYLKKPTLSIEDLMKTLPGPDFPTGGIIVNKNDLPDIYHTGKGRIRIRGKVKFEPSKGRGDKDKLVITEIPYTMIGLGIGKFLSDVADLAKAKVLPEVADILNQTSSKGIRLVIELKNGSDVERVENILYKKTKLEDTMPVNMFYVVKGVPKTLNLSQIFEEFAEFNYTTQTNKYTALLKKQKEIAEIREGLILAVDVIDTIIEVLRGSPSVTEAKNCLMGKSYSKIKFKTKTAEKAATKFSFTELQAQAILDMKLSRLINLELNVLIQEKDNAEKAIKKCKKLLNSKTEMRKVIISELEEIKKKYGKSRKTKLTNATAVEVDLNTFQEANVYIVYDKFGYIRMFDEATYSRNEKSFDKDDHMIKTKNTKDLFVFTDAGNLHQVKIKDIPMCKFKDRGTPIDNLSNYDSSKEHFIRIYDSDFVEKNKFVIVSSNNCIKITDGTNFITSRKTISYTKLTNDATVVGFGVVPEGKLFIQSENNHFMNIDIETIPNQKRTSLGAKCMDIDDNTGIKNVYFIEKGQKEFTIPEISKTIKTERLSKLEKRGSKGKTLRL